MASLESKEQEHHPTDLQNWKEKGGADLGAPDQQKLCWILVRLCEKPARMSAQGTCTSSAPAQYFCSPSPGITADYFPAPGHCFISDYFYKNNFRTLTFVMQLIIFSILREVQGQAQNNLGQVGKVFLPMAEDGTG